MIESNDRPEMLDLNVFFQNPSLEIDETLTSVELKSFESLCCSLD